MTEPSAAAIAITATPRLSAQILLALRTLIDSVLSSFASPPHEGGSHDAAHSPAARIGLGARSDERAWLPEVEDELIALPAQLIQGVYPLLAAETSDEQDQRVEHTESMIRAGLMTGCCWA
jgi:hypothetical protein